MTRYPDLALTAALLATAALVVLWATMPARRRVGGGVAEGATRL